MTIKRLTTALLSLSLLLGLLLPVPALADGQAKRSYGAVLLGNDANLSGTLASRELYFEVEEYWQLEGAELQLDYAVTGLQEQENSSVTVVLNGVKLHSFRPEHAGGERQRLTVALPSDAVIKGVNTLTIEGDIWTGAPEAACVPYEVRSNWLQLFSTSVVQLAYTHANQENSIRGLYQLATGLDIVAGDGSAVVVPQQSDPQELQAALYVLSGLAQASSLPAKPIPLLTLEAYAASGKEAVVMVAKQAQLPETVRAQLSERSLTDKALIQAVQLPNLQVLVVTSDDGALLAKAGRLLMNEQLMQQLDGAVKLVDANTDVDTQVTQLARTIPLTASGDKLTGYRHQERSYFVEAPAGRTIAAGSSIELDMRYAANLQFDRSLVTVLVNDKPIGSKRLSEKAADGDKLRLTLPENLQVTGSFSVTVAFDLEQDYSACTAPQTETPWAYITPDSQLMLYTKDQGGLLWNDYPSPFVKEGQYQQVAVIVPKERDRAIYLTLSNLFNLLGKHAVSNIGELQVYEETADESVLKDRHVIAIGSPADNRVVASNNERLYFQYDEAGSGFISNEKMSIDASYGQRIGTLQLLESPYAPGYGLMAVTAPQTQYIYLASKWLESEAVRWQVYGDAVLTDKDGTVQSFRFKQDDGSRSGSVLETIASRSDVLRFVLAGGLTLVLIVVSLGFLLRKHMKKRGAGDEA